jgi:two-component system sensor histidine kinase DesK
MSTPTAEDTATDCANGGVRMWNAGWQRFVFPCVWLVYLGQAISGVQKYSSGAAAVAGYVIVGAFAACYVIALPSGWQNGQRRYWVIYAIAIGLTVAECFFAHQYAFVFCVYLAVLTVAARKWWSRPGIIALTAITTFGPVLIPGWGGDADWAGGLAVLLVSLAMFGFFHVIHANNALAAARAEVARLAAENERSRIARDLHDLLGHSLTTITVKAGLARRLAERGDTERSFNEIREVEQLSRRTLGDVRAAVAGHREVTLAGELATSREVLRAAAIIAELPGSVDVVDSELSEVFGWVVREGVTNMVRHSHAETCRITLGPRWIEIADTGHGGMPGSGNGIAGLRERVAALGGTITATGSFSGFRLRADVPLLIESADGSATAPRTVPRTAPAAGAASQTAQVRAPA